jgi:membrane peptidoglycan carboxypeptidase
VTRRRFSKIYTLGTHGLLAGVLLACAVLPAALAAGFVVKMVAESYEKMPSELHTPPPAQPSYVYASDGKTLITAFYDEYRHDVKLSDIAPVMRQAIVASEDTRFYKHGGVDTRSVLRAIVANGGSGRVAQGASTLTMQYVRNVLKSDVSRTEEQREAATADSPARKLQEIRYAVALEKKLSKDEILGRYLNIAYFGYGAYGIDAASHLYFSKPASQLTLADAALLAGIVQSPDVDNPVTGSRSAALARRSYVLDSLARMKAVTPAQAARARSQPLAVRPGRTPPNDCVSVSPDHNDWGFFCDYFRQWWKTQPAFGASGPLREQTLRRGGYKIVTSLDPKVQGAATRASAGVYSNDSPKALPLAVVQPGTGRVLALAVNRHFSLAANESPEQSYPNTVNQLIAGGDSVAGYPAGSTFKMFTMLAALDSGLPLSTGFNAPARLTTHWPGAGGANCGGHYCPANESPAWMDGYRTMWDGLGRSVNTYWVWLEERIGVEHAVAMAQRLGIEFRSSLDAELAGSRVGEWGSFTLGTSQTTPLDMANAYAAVAADGIYCQPLPVLSITDSTGRPVPAASPTCRRVVSPDVARAATDAARCPVGQQSHFGKCNGGTADGVSSILGRRPVAGKTGTSEYSTTESFVGFTPDIAAAAIAADPDNARNAVGDGVASSVNAAVAQTMATALEGKPPRDFPAPSRDIALGNQN